MNIIKKKKKKSNKTKKKFKTKIKNKNSTLNKQKIYNKKNFENNILIPNIDEINQLNKNEKPYFIRRKFLNNIIKGDIEKDIPNKFLTVLQNNDEPSSFFIEIEWKKRNNGIQPLNSTYTNKRIKEKFPLLLLDYYEKQILLQHKRERDLAMKIENEFF